MSIYPIPRVQFDALKLPYNRRTPGARDREAGWYANAARQVVGVIFADADGACWSYLVFARQSQGPFRQIGQGMDYNHVGLAEKDLMASMERHVAATEPLAIGDGAGRWERLRVFA